MGYKICSKCKRKLPMSEEYFYKVGNNKLKFRSQCKECLGYSFTNIDKPKAKVGYKICKQCEREFPLNEKYYSKNHLYKDGYYYICKECDGYHITDVNYYSKNDLINIYEETLSGDRKKLLTEIFKDYNVIKIILKYVFEEKYKLSFNDILKLKKSFYIENKLYFTLKPFNSSLFYLLKFLYPENNFVPWEFNITPIDYYSNENNIKFALSWFIEKLFKDKIINNEEKIPQVVSQDLFKKYKLSGLLVGYFNGSPYKAISFLYPNRWQPWEFNQVLSGFWQDEDNIIIAIKWLFEEKLNININDLPTIANREVFIKNNLSTLVSLYDYSDLILKVYPNKFFQWQFGIPNTYWNNEENRLQAIKDMFVLEEIKIEDVNSKIYSKLLNKYYKIRMMIGKYYSSIFEPLNKLYPNRFFKWEFTNCSRWENKKYRIQSLIELIELKEKIAITDIPNTVNGQFLIKNYPQFVSPLYDYYGGDLYKWINECYPDKFKREQLFKFYSHGFRTDSYAESMLNNYFYKYCYSDVEIIYIENNRDVDFRFLNNERNKYYTPDWFLVKDGIIYIIEFFGMYDNYQKVSYIQNYVEKTYEKINFYNQYCLENSTYKFISIFPDDFKNKKKKLKQKLSQYDLIKQQIKSA